MDEFLGHRATFSPLYLRENPVPHICIPRQRLATTVCNTTGNSYYFYLMLTAYRFIHLLTGFVECWGWRLTPLNMNEKDANVYAVFN